MRQAPGRPSAHPALGFLLAVDVHRGEHREPAAGVHRRGEVAERQQELVRLIEPGRQLLAEVR